MVTAPEPQQEGTSEAASAAPSAPPRPPSSWRLIAYFAVFAICAVIAGVTYRVVDWTVAAMSCRVDPGEGSFLANCNSPQYGDYEHGAYWYGLEPEAIAHLRAARVLFLGDSRAQFAFSTRALASWFQNSSTHFHVMGFGYNEQGTFAQALISKYHLHPKVLVIGIDPFFVRALSPPARAIVSPARPWQRFWVWKEYWLRSVFWRVQPAICGFLGSYCPQGAGATYRSFKTGMWSASFRQPRVVGRWKIDGAKRRVYVPPVVNRSISLAGRLFASTRTERSCIVFTTIPNMSFDMEPFATDLGARVGVNVVVPRVAGLSSFDGSHLDAPSAERWSRALLKEIAPIVRRCTASAVKTTPPSP